MFPLSNTANQIYLDQIADRANKYLRLYMGFYIKRHVVFTGHSFEIEYQSYDSLIYLKVGDGDIKVERTIKWQ